MKNFRVGHLPEILHAPSPRHGKTTLRHARVMCRRQDGERSVPFPAYSAIVVSRACGDNALH